MIIFKIFARLFSLLSNIFSNNRYNLSYIKEGGGWVIDQVGEEIVSCLNNSSKMKARLTKSHWGIRNQIVHFGSAHTFLKKNNCCLKHKSNKIILTWFHIVPGYSRNTNIKQAQKHLDFIHTACWFTKNNLIELGALPEKIVVIPLGIDLSLFKPSSLAEKQKIREQIGIPDGKIVIGSFQKDGVGWGSGLEPKLVKGPDIFIKSVEKLAKNYPVFVLLAGPARGYVRLNLEKRNIPYKSIGFIKDFREIGKYYQALDLYLITSRIEGGPRAILEAWASGVPVVSTKVGMVPDIAKHKETVLLAEVENIEQIVSNAETVLNNQGLKQRLITNSLRTVQDYSWQKIAERYFQEIYKKLLI